jgi:hypothetical protein
MHLPTPEWGLVLTGLITGTLAYLLRHRIHVLLQKKEIKA